MTDALTLSLEEAVALTGISDYLLLRAHRAGELGALRFGRQWRFRRVELERWLAAREECVAAAPRPHPLDPSPNLRHPDGGTGRGKNTGGLTLRPAPGIRRIV